MQVTALSARSRGFSLVEVLFTLLLSLMLLGAAVPAWQDLNNRNAVQSARNLMAATLALARQTAIESGLNITVCPSNDLVQCSGDHTAWHAGVILFRDNNANRQRDTGETLFRTIDPRKEVSMHTSSGRRSIRYAPDGSAWGSNLTLRICTPQASQHNRAIILYGSGRARHSRTLSNGDPIRCS